MARKKPSPDAARKTGEPLSANLVKEIRLAHDLSQDELAARLGLRGGKSVVSGWETGRTRCEGPAAELLLKLFANTDATSAASLLTEVDTVWKQAGNYMPAWRQIAIIPQAPVAIERNTFDHLFPGVEVPPWKHVHGFPFVGHGHGLPDDVYSLGPHGWSGIIPTEQERPPHYFWRLGRDATFVYRERIWEDDPMSVTRGHIHFAAQFNMTIPALYFYGRLAERCHLDRALQCELRLDLEGVAGRGMVAYQSARALDDFTLDEPRGTFPRAPLSVKLTAAVQEILSSPRQLGHSLVGEVAAIMRPDLASPHELEAQLQRRIRQDDGGGIRYLAVLERRRAAVVMNQLRVGTLAETDHGTRFEYDAEYLRRPDAIAISPAMPLELSKFEATGLLPFFANLLPEGAQLDWVSQRRHLDRNDRLGILLAAGQHTIGAIEIHALTADQR
jgi:HipA-like protein